MKIRTLALRVISLCCCWYIISASNNVIGKKLLTRFPFPMTITMIHLLSVLMYMRPTFYLLRLSRPQLTKEIRIQRFLPLSCGKVFASVMAHVSLWMIPVSYAHTVKALMPVFTVFLSRVVLGEQQTTKVYLSLLPIVIGVIMASVTEISFDLLGLCAGLLSTSAFALQNIYTKKVLRDYKIHHLVLLLELCQIASLLFFPIWLFAEGYRIFTMLSMLAGSGQLGWYIFMFLLNGLLNYLQSVVAFTMLDLLAPLSYAVANCSKRIIIICVSLVMLRNPVTPENLAGMSLAVGGVLFYNKAKMDAKRIASTLPITSAAGEVNGGLRHSSYINGFVPSFSKARSVICYV